MKPSFLLGQPIRQIAYVVDDVRVAAERHSRLFGSGPFFLVENMSHAVTHHGRATRFDHDAAFGQWGAMQVELLRQTSAGPSILTEIYPEGSGRTGIHHVAVIVDDLDGALAELAGQGYPEIFRGTLEEMDLTSVFVDTLSTFGHFVELYGSVPGIVDFYDMVAQAAIGFDGSDPVRSFSI